MAACFCNALNKHKCCLTECQDYRPGRGGCYPCNTFRNQDVCLRTGQTRAERARGGDRG